MVLINKSIGSVALGLSFDAGFLRISLSGPAALSVAASADVADLLIDGVEKVIPGAIAKAVLEQARIALKAVQ